MEGSYGSWLGYDRGREACRYEDGPRAINRARDARLVAVCSRDRGRAEAFAQKHGAAFAYTSLEEMLANPRVDVLYVASPNSLHAAHTIAAALAGKHVLCEKPMALTLEDCQAMIDACKSRGVKLGMGFHLRHHPYHREAQRLMDSGKLGEVILCHAQWAYGTRGQATFPRRGGTMAWWSELEMVGGGSMMGSGVHAVDLLRFLLRQEVAEVAAFSDGQREEQPLDALLVLLLRFRSGVFGTVVCSRKIPDSLSDAVVYGLHGRIRCINTLNVNLHGELEVVGGGDRPP